jgi:prolyl-tRNA editing enzyme YbaK/EbsC (Cys-tRNA(Pro) deacylase)
VRTFVDETLLAFEELWAAAGTPDSVFPISPAELVRLSAGTAAEFAE